MVLLFVNGKPDYTHMQEVREGGPLDARLEGFRRLGTELPLLCALVGAVRFRSSSIFQQFPLPHSFAGHQKPPEFCAPARAGLGKASQSTKSSHGWLYCAALFSRGQALGGPPSYAVATRSNLLSTSQHFSAMIHKTHHEPDHPSALTNQHFTIAN